VLTADRSLLDAAGRPARSISLMNGGLRATLGLYGASK
jgi:hypothetical protein